MIVYHGSLEIVKNPDIQHSFRPLDFGKGFYVTTVKTQAEIWEKERAIKEIKAYPTYDQIAFITQKAIDKLLKFDSYEEVKKWKNLF